MKSIYIGGSSPTDFKIFAELIMAYSGSDSSHIYTKYQDELTEQWLISESSHGEAHKMVVEKWGVNNRIVEEYKIDVSDELYKMIMTNINHRLQTSYSEANVIGVPIYDLYEATKLELFRFVAMLFSDGKDSTICSEDAAYSLRLLGIEFNRPNDFLHPEHVLAKLRRLEKTEDYITRSI